jgi:hypothetical protein
MISKIWARLRREYFVQHLKKNGPRSLNGWIGADASKCFGLRWRILAQMRSAGHVEQCPSSKAKRKTSTRDEYFAF